MKRAKLGDVYAFKTERGYRLLHWAYYIEKRGEFVRVMPGFYEEIPDNDDIKKIINSECSYISNFSITKLYRKGLLENITNIPISNEFPLPEHTIQHYDYGKFGEYEICETFCPQHFEMFVSAPDGSGLPEKYKKLNLLKGAVDPIWFIYLISSDFDIKNWSLYWPKNKWHDYDKKYGDLIFGKKSKA